MRGSIGRLRWGSGWKGCGNSGRVAIRLLNKDLFFWFWLDWSILPLPMSLVNFWIVEQRFWQLGLRRQMSGGLVIGHQQGVTHGANLPGDATDDLAFTSIALGSLIIATHARDKTLIQLLPDMAFFLNGTPDDEIEHLFGDTRSAVSQTATIKGRSGLFSGWGPSQIGLELRSAGKIGDVANGGNQGCRRDRTNARDRGEDLSLPTVFNNLVDFCLQLLKMVLDQAQLLNELLLFKDEASLTNGIFHSNALARQSLQCQQFRIGEVMILASHFLKGAQVSRGEGLWSGKALAKRQGC